MRRAAAIAALLALPVPSQAAPAEISQEFSAAFQAVRLSFPEAKFEEYRTVPPGLFLRRYVLGLSMPRFSLSAGVEKLLLDDQSAWLAYERSSGIAFRAHWDRTPHVWSRIARTIYAQPETGRFTLPDETRKGLQASTGASTNNLLLALSSLARPVELRLRRDEYGAAISLPWGGAGRAEASLKQVRKRGAKSMAGSLGFNLAVELPEPVDWVTTDLSLATSYRTGPWFAALSYGYSDFVNRVDAVVWDNPRRLDDTTSPDAYTGGTGSRAGRAALPPDNRSHRAGLSFGLDLPLRSRLSGAVGWAQAFQDDALLPLTINTSIKPGAAGDPPFPAYEGASLPVQRMDGRVLTYTQRYVLTSRPAAPLRLQASLRDQVVLNRTRAIVFPGQVRLDQVWEAGEVESHARGNRVQGWDADADLDVLPRLSIGGGYSGETWKRTFREMPETVEGGWKLRVSARPVRAVTVRGEHLQGRRRSYEFLLDDYRHAGNLVELPGLRRSDVADRDRTRTLASASLRVGAAVLSAQGLLEDSRFLPGPGDLSGGVPGFVPQTYGLTDSRRRGVTLGADVPVPFVEGARASLLYDAQQAGTTLRSNVSAGALTQNLADDWTSAERDLYQTAQIELSWSGGAWTVEAGYLHSLGRSAISVSDIPSTALRERGPPEMRTLFQEASARAELSLGSGLSLDLRLAQEIFSVRDFASGDVPLIGGRTAAGAPAPNAIYLGDSLKGYRARVGSAGLRYRF